MQFFKKVTNDIFIVSFELFKIMIPTLILVKVAEIYGLVAVLTNLFAPLMTVMGLPAEMALAITTTMLTNPYAGIIVLASTPGIEQLTVAQTTILASFILFTHSVIIEAAISRQAGLSAGATIIIRILSGVLFCTLLNSVFSTFELFGQTAVLNLPEMSTAPTLKQWIIDQIKGLVFIQFVIIILITFLEILRLLGIEKIIRICLSPFLKILNIGQSASTIVVVGLTLGLGFGGGLMIKDVKQGKVAPRSAVGALIFINLFHSLIEDTTILLLIGPSLFTILVIRGLFVFALTFVLIKIFDNLPINTYDRFLYSRSINKLIKTQN
jgi:hypothetical protein